MHELLAQAAHNAVLAQNLDTLYIHVLRLWNVVIERIGELPSAIEEHLAIAQAVRDGDGARAKSLMRTHVSHFQQSYSRALALSSRKEREQCPNVEARCTTTTCATAAA